MMNWTSKKAAGFFDGYIFVGNNYAYAEYDFDKKQ